MPLQDMTPEQQFAVRQAIAAIQALAPWFSDRPDICLNHIDRAMAIVRDIPNHYGP